MTRSNGVQILTDRVCRNKQRHATQDAAESHRANLVVCGESNLRVYRCWGCGAWHVGHDRLGRNTPTKTAPDLWAETVRGVTPYAQVTP